MLYNGSDVIRDVEWVIFDEVHYVNDSEVSKLNMPVIIICGQDPTNVCLAAYVICKPFIPLLISLHCCQLFCAHIVVARGGVGGSADHAARPCQYHHVVRYCTQCYGIC